MQEMAQEYGQLMLKRRQNKEDNTIVPLLLYNKYIFMMHAKTVKLIKLPSNAILCNI